MHMKYRLLSILSLILFSFGTLLPVYAGGGLAADQFYQEGQVNYNNADVNKQTSAFTGSQGADLGRVKDVRIVIASLVQKFLVVLGTLFLIYMFYGGYLFLTSAGIEDRVEKGKSVLRNAIIGLIIILFSYAATWFIKWLFVATGDETYKDCVPYTTDYNGDPLDYSGDPLNPPGDGC